MTWLDDITAAIGEPRVCVDTEQRSVSTYRRCWVWFPNNINHNIKIDREGGRYVLGVGSHVRGAPQVEVTLAAEPTDQQVRDAVRSAWPDVAYEAGFLDDLGVPA